MRNSVKVLSFSINGDIIAVEFKTADSKEPQVKRYLITEKEDAEKIKQLLTLQSTEFIFNTLKKCVDA